MIVKYEELSFYTNQIIAGNHYSFARYGDGEFSCMIGLEGKNTDGHEYMPALREDLLKTIITPYDYYYGIQALTVRSFLDKFDAILSKVNIKWHSSDIFHRASGKGRLAPLVAALKQRKVCLVGPEYLDIDALSFLTTGGVVPVPEINCYISKERIFAEMAIIGKNSEDVVFAFSASMLTNVLIYELYPIIGNNNWLIDFGSLWDVYVGRPSRSYHHKMIAEGMHERLMA